MSCLVCYRNRWRNGEIVAVSSEDPQCSAEYTQDDSPQLFWRSTDDFDTAVTIDCDLGTAYEYDFIAILGHNLTSAADIIIYGTNNPDFTTDTEHDHIAHHGNYIYKILDDSRTYRYIRISILNPTNGSGYLQVGTIIVGKAEYFNRMPSVPYQASQINETEVEYSPSANMFTVQEQPSAFAISVTFIGLNQSTAVMVENLIRECGSFKAFVLCLDSGNANSKSDWLVLTDQGMLTNDHVDYWTWTLNAVEVL